MNNRKRKTEESTDDDIESEIIENKPKRHNKGATSAVEGVSINILRRSLSFVRSRWQQNSILDPVVFNEQIPHINMSIEAFCFKFLRGKTSKRKKIFKHPEP